VQQAGIAGEDLPDVVGVGEHYPVALLGDLHAEGVAVPLSAAAEEGPGTAIEILDGIGVLTGMQAESTLRSYFS